MTIKVKFIALSSEAVNDLRRGSAADAYGRRPERIISDGDQKSCRHCLNDIPAGTEMLVLAWRPFPEAQFSAETSPIYLCAHECKRHKETAHPPAFFSNWGKLLIRGYGVDDKVVNGFGQIVQMDDIKNACEAVLGDPSIAYIHVHSADSNVYQMRVERA